MGRWISNSCLTRDLLHCKPSCHGSQVWCFWQGIRVPRYVFIMLIYTCKHFHLQLSLPVDLTSMLCLVNEESLFVQTFNFSDDFHHMNTSNRQFLSANTNRICHADLRSRLLNQHIVISAVLLTYHFANWRELSVSLPIHLNGSFSYETCVISHNCEFISYLFIFLIYLYFFAIAALSHNCYLRYHNWDIVSCNCNFISNNYKFIFIIVTISCN